MRNKKQEDPKLVNGKILGFVAQQPGRKDLGTNTGHETVPWTSDESMPIIVYSG